MQEVLNNNNGSETSLPPNQRKPREYTLNEEELKDIVFNATSRDMRGLRKLMMEKRDYDSECDYPAELTVYDHYKFYFDYHAVATRTVEVLPLETWQVQPQVYEDDDPNVKTEFEKAWDELGSNLRGQSWHKKEEGSPVWEYLKRADILSGIGSFGVILLGFDDNQPLNTPVAMLAEEDDDEESDSWDTTEESDTEGISETDEKVTTNVQGSIDSQYDGSVFGTDKVPKLKEGTKRKLIFMRPFDETLVQVIRLETDIASPRHNQPVMYRLTLIDPDFAKEHNIAMNIACPEVHWTRILHIADNLTNSECFGVPRQQPVYRHLRNLYKLYGGAPEMYWRGAMNGLSFETHPQLGGDVDVDKDAFKDMIENFRNGLQRDLQTSGMTVKSIAPNVTDATPFIDTQITAICIKIGCPQRIFMGSERGELASSQDDSSWNDRLKHRQQMYVTPRIIIPFIDRMISTGVLPKPSGKIVEENLTEDDGQDQELIDETGTDSEETVTNFNPNQPRDSEGKFSSGGGKAVMYRGIGSGADTSTGFEWFSETPELATKYADFRGGKVVSQEIEVQKPLMVTNPNAVTDSKGFFAQATKQIDVSKLDKEAKSKVLAAREGFNQHFGSQSRELVDYWSNPEAKTKTRNLLEAMGYDSIVMKEGNENTVAVLRKVPITNQRSSLQGKPTVNAFGKPSSIDSKGGNGGKTNNPPTSGGNAAKAMPKPGGDNVGTGPEASVPAAPKKRVLPEKDGEPGYCIVWPDLDSMTEAQKATIALQKTQALMAFIAGNGESAMTLVDFYTKVLYMTDEEAIGVITAVNEQIENDERLTPDPEQARQDEMEMQGEQFDKELEAKKELAEQGHGFGMEMQDKQLQGQEKLAQLKPKGKPVANRMFGFSETELLLNYNPNQPRDSEGQWSRGSGGGVNPEHQKQWEEKYKGNKGVVHYATQNDHGLIRDADSLTLEGLDLKQIRATDPQRYENIKRRLDNNKKYKKQVTEINKVIDTAPGFEGEVYRGVTISAYASKSYQSLKEEGATVTLDTFQSWSKKKDVAQRFSRGEDDYTLSVKLSTRTKAADISNIGGSNEGEVLTKRGSQFKVLSVDHNNKSITLEEYFQPTTNKLSALQKAWLIVNYNPNQPRDAQGQWTGGGSAGGGKEPVSAAGMQIMEKYKNTQADHSAITEFMEAHDLTIDDYKAVNEQYYSHNIQSGGETEKNITEMFYSDTREGKAARLMSQWNEWQYENVLNKKTPEDTDYNSIKSAAKKADAAGNWDSFRRFREGGNVSPTLDRYLKLVDAEQRGETIQFRKGNYNAQVVSTTSDPKGARSGSSRFKPDSFRTYDEMKAEGFHLAAGARGLVGTTSATEREYIWVRTQPSSPVANYNPSQKRDTHGRWSGGGAVKTTSKGEELHAVMRNHETKQWIGTNGTPAPEHIQKLGIPPGWNSVHVNPDPDGTMLARGVDSKGRAVYKYSANDQAKNAAAKFGRVTELRQKRTEIFAELAKDSKNPEHKENADCLKVIMQTGIRPGSDKDTKADHQSFGATTLQGRHVKVAEDGSVSLKFATGKNKGREVEFPIGDPTTASMLINRAMSSGAEGNLFKTEASSLRDYSKGKDGGGFKTKDHRTALGTETAIREIQKRPVPKNMTEYKAATKEVATVVAKTLGNTPAIALKSYIDPTVFGSWKPTN